MNVNEEQINTESLPFVVMTLVAYRMAYPWNIVGSLSREHLKLL